LTGEIAFKIKGDGEPEGFDSADYPGLVKVVNHYEVVASTPAEFVVVFARLKKRTDLDWVEAVVLYGDTSNTKPHENPKK
jgi:hypothetical protein